MSAYSTYFLMKTDDISQYVKEKFDYFDQNSVLTVKEIGDANLNYVFHVVDKNSGKSIIVKQAGQELRISKEMKISTDRNRIESEILQIQDKFAPGLVPKVYHYDTVMCASIMEDLSDYQIMRKALMEHKIFPNFADHITTYMVNTLLKSTDIALDHKQKKSMVKSFINPELCEITEDLVMTEPFNDINSRNLLFEPNIDFVTNQLYKDKELHLEVAKLKFDFMNNAQALIHGDLHTGSIFVKQDSTKVFDPEFAFYGPMGYDVGNVIANLLFAWDNGYSYDKEVFCEWILKTVADVIDLFKEKFLDLFDQIVIDKMAKTDGFKEYYLNTIISDTAGYTATELIRRTVGMAQVKDVTTIKDQNKRTYVERVNILSAKEYIKNRHRLRSGNDFVDIFTMVVESTKNTF